MGDYVTRVASAVASLISDNVIVRDERDVVFLGNSFDIYERASSAKVNWGKSQALQTR